MRAALLASITLFAVLSVFFDMLSFFGMTKLYLLLVAAAVIEAGRVRSVARPVWRRAEPAAH